jgi:hypothetical protein
MKRILFSLAVVLAMTWMACKPAAEAPQVIPAAMFQSMLVQHPVKDFDAWKPVFQGHDSVRTAHGLRTIGIAREMNDPNQVIIFFRVGDMQQAKDFIAMPELKTIMDSSGVTAPPTITFVNVVRNDTTTIPQKDRIMVSHHVKDFGAWLKVYDKEGSADRAQYGLIDRAMGRGVEDSNMVYLIFAVTDMEKAKARTSSPELKKMMEEAGVDSEPKVLAYTFDMLKE